MSRPFKDGLDYFELDCQLDDKIRMIQAEFGLIGFAVVVKLFQKIYGGYGYYSEWNDDILFLFMLENGLDRERTNLIQEIVRACIRRNLFSEDLFNRYGILTSSGIQRRYLNAVARRDNVVLKKEYLLVNVAHKTVNADINSINVNINSINADINSQSREEKSREKKSREEKRKEEKSREEESREGSSADAPPPKRPLTASRVIEERGFVPELESALKKWVKYKSEMHQGYKETGLKTLLTRAGNEAAAYGAEAVITIIEDSISNGYKGITWDRIRKHQRASQPGTQSHVENRLSMVKQWTEKNSEF